MSLSSPMFCNNTSAAKMDSVFLKQRGGCVSVITAGDLSVRDNMALALKRAGTCWGAEGSSEKPTPRCALKCEEGE